MTSIAERRAAFRALHEQGCFVIPNPWDIGSARRLEKAGFKALASTSSGAAWSLGREDYELGLDDLLAHLRMLVAATDLPINADFENGFADAPDDVAANVRLAIATGVAGVSIEDMHGGAFYAPELATARIAAARAAIDASGEDVMLIGRCEAYLMPEGTGLAPVLARLQAYAEAGADVLFAPGIRAPADVAAIVAAVAPKPVNVLVSRADQRVADYAAVGVRRISVGGALAARAWRAFDDAVELLKAEGRLP
jgi:2-methylisocitrate lyase-like PEP mutase family enzyme